MRVVGVVNIASPSGNASVDGLYLGLREMGYVDGRNIAIEFRWLEGHFDRLPESIAEFVSRNVDVLAVAGGPLPALAAKRATSTIPIVFVTGGDPVAQGLVASLARPGGNLTGFSIITFELNPKRLELLVELVPQSKVLALLLNPNTAPAAPVIEATEAVARAHGVQLHILKAATAAEIDTVFDMAVELTVGGLVVGGDPFLFARRAQLVALAARHAIPAIYEWREFAAEGGLISYGTSLHDTGYRAGLYIGRILAGAKPADLPVQQPTTFELIINLKTAKALDLTVPRLLLSSAHEVIE